MLLEPLKLLEYARALRADDRHFTALRSYNYVSVHRLILVLFIVLAQRGNVHLIGIRRYSVDELLCGELIFVRVGILWASRATAHANDLGLYHLQQYVV